MHEYPDAGCYCCFFFGSGLNHVYKYNFAFLPPHRLVGSIVLSFLCCFFFLLKFLEIFRVLHFVSSGVPLPTVSSNENDSFHNLISKNVRKKYQLIRKTFLNNAKMHTFFNAKLTPRLRMQFYLDSNKMWKYSRFIIWKLTSFFGENKLCRKVSIRPEKRDKLCGD